MVYIGSFFYLNCIGHNICAIYIKKIIDYVKTKTVIFHIHVIFRLPVTPAIGGRKARPGELTMSMAGSPIIQSPQQQQLRCPATASKEKVSILHTTVVASTRI